MASQALAIISEQDRQAVAPAMEMALMKGDLSGLNARQRVELFYATCKSIGVKPLTHPFMFIIVRDEEGNKKLVLYPRKELAEQLRVKHNIFLFHQGEHLDKENGIYTVTYKARLLNGREDIATGRVALVGHKKDGSTYRLTGQRLADAMMKAETKAKRRVTLSIMGLWYLDEIISGVESGQIEMVSMENFEPKIIDMTGGEDNNSFEAQGEPGQFEPQTDSNGITGYDPDRQESQPEEPTNGHSDPRANIIPGDPETDPSTPGHIVIPERVRAMRGAAELKAEIDRINEKCNNLGLEPMPLPTGTPIAEVRRLISSKLVAVEWAERRLMEQNDRNDLFG